MTEGKPLGLVHWADRLQKISEDDLMTTGLAGMIQEIVGEMRGVMSGGGPGEPGEAADGMPEVLMIRTDRDGAKFWEVLKFSYGDLGSTGSPMLDAIRANLNTMGVASIELLPEMMDDEVGDDQAAEIVRESVWGAWNALSEGDESPVKRISLQLDLPAALVAAIVYPEDRFGTWDPAEEPDITTERARP